MDHPTAELVRHSWKRVEAIAPAAAALIRDNLFAADPALRPLFKSDMAHQGERRMKMIGASVDKPDDLPTLVPVLQGLARRHVGHGVREAHHQTVGAAMRTSKLGSTAMNMTATPPPRSARLTRLLSAVAMAVTAPAFAGVIFDRGDISIAAIAELVVDGDARGEINFDVRSGVRSPGDPKEVEAWTFGGVQGRGWQNFVGGTPTSLDSFSFASALANGAGVAGVGVSGWLDSTGFGTMQSVLNVTGDVVNVGTAGNATFTYAIPQMEIVAEGTRYNGTVAAVRSRLAFGRFLNDGSPPTYFSVYDYRLHYLYDKPPETYAVESFLASPDLLRDSRGLQTIDFTGQCCGLRGVRTLPFSITTQIDNVGVGEIIEFYSIMSTEFRVGREGGGHALYGDPWQFTGSSGYGYGEFAAATPAVSVPEPATWALMLAGLLAAGLAQRAAASCRRSGGCLDSGDEDLPRWGPRQPDLPTLYVRSDLTGAAPRPASAHRRGTASR